MIFVQVTNGLCAVVAGGTTGSRFCLEDIIMDDIEEVGAAMRLQQLAKQRAQQLNKMLTSARLDGERTGIIKGLDMAIGKLSERIETNGAPVRTLKELKSDYQKEKQNFDIEIHCKDCGKLYEQFGLDLILPDQQWKMICQEDIILCANCICKRARHIGGTVLLAWIDQIIWEADGKSEYQKEVEDENVSLFKIARELLSTRKKLAELEKATGWIPIAKASIQIGKLYYVVNGGHVSSATPVATSQGILWYHGSTSVELTEVTHIINPDTLLLPESEVK